MASALASAAPFQYHEDFETADPVKFWVSNGTVDVHFKGLSDEAAHGGRRSFKLDLTLRKGTYFYWQVPMKVAADGSLRLSAWVKIVPPTSAAVGIGANYQFPPTRHSGCGPVERLHTTKGEWQQISGDLVADGQSRAAGVVQRYVAGATGDDVVVLLDRLGIFVYGCDGQRLVCYIDDVILEGDVPALAAHEALGRERFRARLQQFAGRVDAWKKSIEDGAAPLAAYTTPNPLLEHARGNVRAAQDLLARFERAGYASLDEVRDLEQRIELLGYTVPNLEAMTKGGEGKPAVIFVPRAITNQRILPTSFPIPARIADRLDVTACPGEYEAATFAVHAFGDLHTLRVEVGALDGPSGTLPADVVDVRVVKCWYQGKGNIGRSAERVLKPELLLKDDGLIRVDHETKRNFMRQTDAAGRMVYVDISRDLDDGETTDDLKDLRPRDAATLQPVSVPKGTTKQFWLTVRVPDNARAGRYRGVVRLRAANVPEQSLTLELQVLPFRLAPSPLTYSIYYRARLAPDGKPTATSELKSEEQFLAELRNMKAHGVDYPTNYQGHDERLLRQAMELRKQAGLPRGPFFSLGINTGNAVTPDRLAAKQTEVRKWLALIREYGHDELYVYGFDEAKGERLRSQRKAWTAVQAAGGKTFVAGYRDTFEAMGGLLDCLVFAGRPDPEEAKKFHGVGSRIFCYANPQVGVEEPETYRRNFGFVLWKAGFDGAMDYAYQHSFGHIWNDFDHVRYRDHVFAYPTMDGVIDTLAWEGFREAVDDARYLATLQQAIREAGKSGGAVAEAEAWIDGLDPTRDLDELRREMIGLIVRLRREK